MELRKLTEEDLKNNIGLLSFAYNTNKDLYPLFFEYEYDGDVKYLYCYDNWFTILCKKSDKQLKYYQFALDDEYELLYSGYEDFYVDHSEELADVIVSDIYNLSFALVYGKAEVSNGVLDGYVAFTQTKPDDSTLSFAYSTYYDERRKIYKSYLQQAYLYYYTDCNHKRTKYLRQEVEYDLQPSFFYSISIKEYGLSEVLKQGPVRLQKSGKVNRYFKLPFNSDKLNNAFSFFAPFYKIYTQEQFYKMIEDNGFLIEIPEFVLDYYNGNNKRSDEYKELALAIKEYYKQNNMVLVMNLDRGVNL